MKAVKDVDRDGKTDKEFYGEVSGAAPRVGLQTARGAVIATSDTLPGGGDHGVWITGLETGPSVMVIDDGHIAELYYLADCKWVQAKGTGGKPYQFALGGGTSKYGTGVGCIGSARDGYQLAGLNAVELSGGRFRIDETPVHTKDGKTAENAAVLRGQKTSAQSSSQVERAVRSSCEIAPKITHEGR